MSSTSEIRSVLVEGPSSFTERYRIVGVLGQGGCGIVYRGRDEDLGRPVAIKVVEPSAGRRDASGQLAARMRRESKALAALSHPNVVAVYDVIEAHGSVGIVMELVDGVNLDHWLEVSERPVEEIVEVLHQAGRGLDAAHKEGIVHRDFKPGNVMVGADGRVRVLDFGLARGFGSTHSSRPHEPGNEMLVSRITDLDVVITHGGIVMGTPAYMAPEQMEGKPVDARSDQFSFCVTLFEALTGERPFERPSAIEQRRAMDDGPPPLPRVSRQLREAVERGLAVRPDDRHRSMQPLLGALARESEPPPRRWWLAGVVVAGVAVAVGSSVRGEGANTCEAAEPQTESWSVARRSAVRAAFLAVDVPFAQATWETTEADIDAYVERWSAQRGEVCGDVPVDESRVSCLGRVEARFDALLDIFVAADVGVVENAKSALQRLPEPEKCQRQRADAFGDPSLEALHARAAALAAAGRFEESLVLAEDLLEQAVAAENPSYEATALLLTGSNEDELGRYEAAVDRLEDAYFVALRIGAYELAARAALRAAAAAGTGSRRVELGRTWLRHARTQIARLDDQDRMLADALDIEGGIALLAGAFDDGLDALEKAYALQLQIAGEDDIGTVTVMNNLGLVNQRLGRFEEALQLHQHSKEFFEQLYGPEHPGTTSAEHAIAGCLVALGRTEDAVALYRRLIAKWEASLGHDHPRVAMTYYNIGFAHQQAQEYEQALLAYEQAVSFLETAVEPDHINIAMAVHNLGSVLHELGRLDEAQV
jgi:tetratricopeptide (TPR) repeat protein/predicted Ser/Thr protein kinase